MKYLVTGVAGFIGSEVALKLVMVGHDVVGIDNLNAYYDPALKNYRLEKLNIYTNFRFKYVDLSDHEAISKLFENESFQRVIHLGAQAGVRHSIHSPFDYINSNITGMMTILEGCRHHKVEHLVYASSSSIYGLNRKTPFHESDQVDQPISLYAATKKSNELMAHSYAHLYHLPVTGVRFFTVYGPAGRPDMAPWLFTEAILKGEPIKVFNHGKLKRDFTYIDDIVEGLIRIQDAAPCQKTPYQIFNIGNNQPIELNRFIEAIESACGKKAEKIYLDMQPGDVEITYADISALERVVGYKPSTDIEDGMRKFVSWYRNYKGNLE